MGHTPTLTELRSTEPERKRRKQIRRRKRRRIGNKAPLFAPSWRDRSERGLTGDQQGGSEHRDGEEDRGSHGADREDGLKARPPVFIRPGRSDADATGNLLRRHGMAVMAIRSEEHTSEHHSLMHIPYAV